MSVYEILDKIIDSKNTTVGGGAASALAGAQAAGLAGMAARLSAGKGLGLTDERCLALAEELDIIAEKLKLGAINDEEAFLRIKEAFAMPKSNENEMALRRAAIGEAALTAANVPLHNGRLAVRVWEIINELDGRYNPATASDFECAKMLAQMAITGCALNVDANLPLIKNQEAAAALAEASASLKKTHKKVEEGQR